MEVNDERVANIDSREHWNNTEITLIAGRRYVATAKGTWTDASKVCDADGWVSDSPLVRDLEVFRRFRKANWFALIGAFDQDSASEFVIGTSCEFTASRGGILTCFANDALFMYWNNSGSVQLTIKRLS